MDKNFIHKCIGEFYMHRSCDTGHPGFILEAALFLEAVFPARFTDENIETAVLGNAAAAEAWVLKKLETACAESAE